MFYLSQIKGFKGNCIRVLEGHTDVVHGLAFSSNDTLASCSFDKTIRIWNIDSGECLKVLEGHTDWVSGLAFSSNDTLASCDKTIRIWRLNFY